MKPLLRKHGVTLYHQLYLALRRDRTTRLTEAALRETYQVSRSTVRRALAMLRAEQKITTVRGRGSRRVAP